MIDLDLRDVRVTPVTEAGLAALAETVTPQGVVAVCRHRHQDLGPLLQPRPDLVAVLAGIADPGNAGTVLRTADAAGAAAVVFPDGSVDPYNGKCVRASAGSLFHVELGARWYGRGRGGRPAHGRADGAGGRRVRGGRPRRPRRRRSAGPPTAWLFGSEAHGLPAELAGSGRRAGAGAHPRARREPQPGGGGRGVPIFFGESATSRSPLVTQVFLFMQPASGGPRG
jgi:TrmH family RNA methyltransferase